MKTADLYVRVSTDEQADKGYSQRDQEERLRRYCEINNIIVHKVIMEDHSAKSFDRPAWSRLLAEIKKTKGKRNLILFTKWDRFSRNAGDAYMMIGILRKLGVEPQAVEQPLDLSIPENKMMLAFYLAAPEVENDRRALNTFYGMRRAKKEGRWVSGAPIGYKNMVSENGKKYIAPKEPKASIMRWVFEEIARNNWPLEHIRKMANKEGLKCERMNFWRLVRNPVYCGKIIVPQHKDEEQKLAQGQHEPLISESLFYEVQDVLEGRKRKKAALQVSLDELPLRGLVACPNCHRMLTGSKSKGKRLHYYYYHCACGVRLSAPKFNQKFIEQLEEYCIRPEAVELFRAVITQVYKSRTHGSIEAKKSILQEIDQYTEKISKARRLLLDEAIEADDFKAIKSECEAQIMRLEAKMSGLKENPLEKININVLIDKVLRSFVGLDERFKNADIKKKRQMVCSLFPEKVEFDGERYRTPRPNLAAEAILLINRELKGNKKGKEAYYKSLSLMVARRGIEHCS
ncbi:MAG TPA: recombinase family protein [Mucilaginibacter sp.]|nr:recombinase family protein [Mucilaginibacter sp.]